MIGNIINTAKYGPYAIIADEGFHAVTVQFLETGYTHKTTRPRALAGKVRDQIKDPKFEVGQVLQNHKGQEFTLIEKPRPNYWIVRFTETGFQKEFIASAIRQRIIKDLLSPSVYDVGCLGDGPYKTGSKGVPCRLYQLWHSMMQRCYCPATQSRYPTYQGCSVCDRWLNYQNFCEDIQQLEGFAEWEKNEITYSLDKDTITYGNKLYSPATCLFIPKSENTREAMTRKVTAN